MRPRLLFRLFASVVFPFAADRSAVWWWHMHDASHLGKAARSDWSDPVPGCRYCEATVGGKR